MRRWKLTGMILAACLLLCACAPRGEARKAETKSQIPPVEGVTLVGDETIELFQLIRCTEPYIPEVVMYASPSIETETDRFRPGETVYINAVRQLTYRFKEYDDSYTERWYRALLIRDGKTLTGWIREDLLPGRPAFKLKEGAKYYQYEGYGRKWTEHIYDPAKEPGMDMPFDVVCLDEKEGMWQLAGSGGKTVWVEDLSVLTETERPDPADDESPLPAG